MVRTKNPNVDEGGSWASKKSKKNRLVSESQGPKAKKRKDDHRKEVEKWKKSLERRKVTCERTVSTMEGADAETKKVVKILKDHGLSFFCKSVRGYTLHIIYVFFLSLEIVGDVAFWNQKWTKKL